MLKVLVWAVAGLLAMAGVLTTMDAAAQPRPDYVTPSIAAHAGLAALSQACTMRVPTALIAAKSRLQTLAVRNGWPVRRFEAAYAAALALAVRRAATTQPAQRAQACTRLRALASEPPHIAPMGSPVTGNQPSLRPFDPSA